MALGYVKERFISPLCFEQVTLLSRDQSMLLLFCYESVE